MCVSRRTRTSCRPGPSVSTSKVGFQRPSKADLCVIFGDDLQTHWSLGDRDSLLEKLVEDAREPIEGQRYSRNSQLMSYQKFESWETNFIEDTIIVGD